MENTPENTSKPIPFYKNRRIYLSILFFIGIGLAIFFGIKAFRNIQRIQSMKFGGGETNVELIRGWMTVDYITKMYHVPPDVVLKPLNLPVKSNMKISIGSLIKAAGTSNPEVLMNQVKASINDFQQKDLKPTPPRPPEKQP
ncbi:MAG: hypothetical protein WCG34_03055 [Leptolinea sp.]